MYVSMYVCIDVLLHLCIFCMSGLTINKNNRLDTTEVTTKPDQLEDTIN